MKIFWQYISSILIFVLGICSLLSNIFVLIALCIGKTTNLNFLQEPAGIIIRLNITMFFFFIPAVIGEMFKDFMLLDIVISFIVIIIPVLLVISALFFLKKNAKKYVIFSIIIVSIDTITCFAFIGNIFVFILSLVYRIFTIFCLVKSFKWVEANYEYYN